MKEALQLVKADNAENPVELTRVNIPGGDFMMPAYADNLTIHINLNEAHEFYSVIFAPSKPAVKNGLFLILYFLAKQELEMTETSPKSKNRNYLVP